MKKKSLIHPVLEIILSVAMIIVIAFIMNYCTRDIEQAQINEMLEYHSAPDQLTVEQDGYVKIIKQ